jgi:hypothetical protein
MVPKVGTSEDVAPAPSLRALFSRSKTLSYGDRTFRKPEHRPVIEPPSVLDLYWVELDPSVIGPQFAPATAAGRT